MTDPEPPPHVTVFVATPADDGHRLCFWRSMLDLATAPAPAGVSIRLMPMPGDSLITRIRNNIVHGFMTSCRDEYLLFLDSDLDFRACDVHRLIEVARTHEGIVCGLYGKKQDELGWVINTLPGTTVDIPGPPQKIACAGTGAMLIPRTVIAKMIAERDNWPHWRVAYRDDNANHDEKNWLFFDGIVDDPEEFSHSPRILSEDWAFCYMARKLGFDVWIVPDAVFLHEGNCLYPMQARRQTQEEVAASEAAKSGPLMMEMIGSDDSSNIADDPHPEAKP